MIRIGNVEHKFTNPAKFDAMYDLVEGTMAGNIAKKHKLVEHLSTGDDSIFALGAVLNAQVLDMYEEETTASWTEIADVRSVPDFETPRFYTAEREDIAGNSRPAKGGKTANPDNVLPIVPEGSPYPRFTFREKELLSPGQGLHKRGGIFSLTWERIIGDVDNLLPQIPGILLDSFTEAESFEVWDALLGTKAKSGVVLEAGTTIDGRTSVKNAPLSIPALQNAITQMKNRTVDGRKVQFNGGFTLVVPVGVKEQVEYLLNTWRLEGKEVTNGTTTEIYSVQNWNPVQGITKIVESVELDGPEWFLVVNKGTAKFPGVTLFKLAGHENPDIRFENVNGVYAGGGAVGPFEGSFETDDAALRGRLPLNGAVVDITQVLYSNGTGA